MNESIKVVSFDVEGTLVTPDFSMGMWYECIPEYYGRKNGISFEEAREAVAREYDRIGDGRLEWYDVRYWFKAFDLGDFEPALRRCLPRIRAYPETRRVLDALGRHYRVVAISASIREFLGYLTADVADCFEVVVSSVSDYSSLKTPELYREVAERLGVRPGEMAHVGDNRQYDYVNPLAAGLRAYHLDRPGQNNGDGIVADLEQFASALLGAAPD